MIAVGVDAGGTATVALASRDGVVSGRAQGGPANPSSGGAAAAAAVIAAAIREACGAAAPDAIVAGAAGAGRAATADALAAALRAAFPGARVEVCDDARIALRAAVPDERGAVLIAGTGSIAYARGPQGVARCGGHGYLLGDEGSAFALGMAAVRRYARVLDGRERADETTTLVARALSAPDRDALHVAIYDAPLRPATIAALAPSIIAFAGKGNRVSTKIVQDGAKDLGELLRAAVKAAGLLEASPPLIFAGGLLAENSLLTFLLETRVAGDLPGATVIRNAPEPVAGALALAQAVAATPA